MVKRWMIVSGCLALALVLRVGCSEWLHARGEGQLPDSQLYRKYATAVFRGERFFDGESLARRAPGYPVFIALCWKFGGVGSERAVAWAQAVASTVTCWLAYRLALRFERPGGASVATDSLGLPAGAALATLVLTTFEPYSIVLSTQVLSETIFATLLVGSAVLGVEAQRRTAWDRGAGFGFSAGVCAGLASLVRPSGLLLAPLAVLLWVACAERRRAVARCGLLGALGLALTMAPWWWRNYRVFDAFVPSALNVGESLYDGLNPRADGGSDMRFLEENRGQPADELARDRYWWRRGVEYARAHPKRVAELAAIKFARYWSPWPNAAQFRRPVVVASTSLATVAVWLLAVWGGFRLRRRPSLPLLFLTPAAYFCALHLVFVSSVRYRVPAMPMLIVLAGAGLVFLVHRIFGTAVAGATTE